MHETMRNRAKITGLLLGVLAIIFVVRVLIMIQRHEIIWLVLVSHSKLTANGSGIDGRILRGEGGRLLIVTLDAEKESGSYWVVLPIIIPVSKPGLVYLCNWTPPRLPAFPVSGANPPCWIPIERGGDVSPGPSINRRLEVSADYVEFTADDGRRIRAIW
jgi:hypothetical protein